MLLLCPWLTWFNIMIYGRLILLGYSEVCLIIFFNTVKCFYRCFLQYWGGQNSKFHNITIIFEVLIELIN